MPIRYAGRGTGLGSATGAGGGVYQPVPVPPAGPGQILGRVVDAAGGPLPGATVAIDSNGQRQTSVTDASGIYSIYNVPPGNVTINAQLAGFKNRRQSIRFTGQGVQVNLTLELSGISETVTVNAESPTVDPKAGQRVDNQAPSANVQNLQRRASGVLPIRIEVPRTGVSHSFVKPLLIDEEAVVTFRYKRK
jgi:hypothetical protein